MHNHTQIVTLTFIFDSATLQYHSCLSKAAAYASFQMTTIGCMSLLTVFVQFVLG